MKEGWQPIDTAPKGRNDAILVFDQSCGWNYFVVHWSDRNGGFWSTLDSDYQPFWGGPERSLSYPTHWMPLPKPPATN